MREVARIESYPPDEMDRATADALSRRIVEVATPIDINVLKGRLAALLSKPVLQILQITINPQDTWVVLRAPTPVEYKIAQNTLFGCQVDDATGEVLEDADGKILVLPTEV